MRTIIQSVISLVPRPIRRRIKALLPDRASRAIAETVALGSSRSPQPPPLQPKAVQRTPRVSPARSLFDADWYTGRYPNAPKDHEEAYRYYLSTGMKERHLANQDFENISIPRRASIPAGHLYRATASPILSRVPPTRYLEPYQIKKRLHKLYGTFDQYLRRALLMPSIIGTELWENDLRVVAYMDNTKKRLAADYSNQPQDTLISIVLPIRNRSAALGDAVVSVIIQSYEAWELVVVDDTGEDPAVEDIVRQFNDERIKYLRLDEPVGMSHARNTGIQHSSGQIIAYLDDDTQWDPDFLLVLLNQMNSEGARIVYCAQAIWDQFDPDARLGKAFKCIRFAPFNRSLLENINYISPTALLHQRELLDEAGWFEPSPERHSNWDLVLRLTEVETPVAVPCLLSHQFQDDFSADTPPHEDEAENLGWVRSGLVQRAGWSQPFNTTDGTEHKAFSTSRRIREARQQKLSRISTETVQILIPNYESVSELEMCLRSIKEHTPSPYRVLVVDNGSSEEAYGQLAKLAATFENVRLIKEDRNSGFSFAVNRGLAEIADRNDQILILNNDILATPDWLDELRYVLFKHEDAGMAVPRQVLPAGSKAAKIHMPGALSSSECDVNLSTHHNNVVDLNFDQNDGLIELSYAPLFCGLVRPQTIKAIGGLDSGNGPHYRSDWIFCDSIRRHLNQRIIYTPHSKVYHLQGVATEKRKESDENFIKKIHTRKTIS